MNNIDAIKAKIAKLMAMGTHANSNEFEAEAALRQAAALMRKHAIDAAEIANATDAAPAFDWYTINIPADPVNGSRSAISWLGQVAVGIALFTDTRAIWKNIDGYGACLSFQGESTDVHYAAWLAKHLRDAIRAQSATYVPVGPLADRTRRAREDFRNAMARRLCERMRELRAEQKAAMQSAGESNALTLIDTKLAARDAQFGKMTTRRRSSRYGDASASNAGRSTGDKVGFGRPVAHASPARALGHAS